MTVGRHPREYSPCAGCGVEDADWEQHRTLPQVGQTYVCSACGYEAYVYGAGWMVEREDWSQSDWAAAIAVTQQAVSKNVAAARARLSG